MRDFIKLYFGIKKILKDLTNMMKKIIIAEIGSTHDGSIKLAKESVKMAAKSGADFVKFQMHIAEEETLENAPSPYYFKNESRYEYFKRTSFNLKNWKEIIDECKKYKVGFLCSPFSLKAVDILEKLKVKYYKVPSGELTNLPLISKLAKTKKKIFLSTGMSSWKEIEQAVKLIHKKNFLVMQCSSIYPCNLRNVGSNIFYDLKKKYKEFGFSDHTTSFAASCLAASLGASVIEKHFTLSKKLYGSDAKFSMEPSEFKEFCKIIKDIWYIQNFKINKNDLKKYSSMKRVFEKSIVSKKFIKKGSKIKFEDLNFKKPGDGVRADKYKKIIGKIARRNIKANHKLKNSDF